VELEKKARPFGLQISGVASRLFNQLMDSAKRQFACSHKVAA